MFEFDSRTAEYVDSRVKLNGTKSTYEPVARDKNEKFVYELIVDLSKLEPTVACHPDPGQRKKAKDMDMKLDRAYVGSCTGGKTSDFVEFAHILRGKKVVIDTFGVPATPEIVRDLQSTYWGNTTIWDVLVNGRRADDRERRLRRVPRRTGGHVWPHQQIRHQVHQRDQPQFPRPHGRQGIAGVPRVADDGGGERVDRQGPPIRASIWGIKNATMAVATYAEVSWETHEQRRGKCPAAVCCVRRRLWRMQMFHMPWPAAMPWRRGFRAWTRRRCAIRRMWTLFYVERIFPPRAKLSNKLGLFIVTSRALTCFSTDRTRRRATRFTLFLPLKKFGRITPRPVPDVFESEATETFRLLSLDALVRMKLTSFRDKDRVHLRDLMDVGLVDAGWLEKVPVSLRPRLQELLDNPEG